MTTKLKIQKDTEGVKAGLDEIIVLVYGEKKVGKSTFAAQFPSPLFLDCEDGLRTVHNAEGKRPDHISVSDWETLVSTTQALAKDTMGYKTLVVDGLNEAWSYLIKYILDKNNVEHLNDGVLAYGKGKGITSREFRYWFQTLRRLPMGIVLCAHDKIIDFEHNGVKFNKRIPFVDDSKTGDAWDTIKPAINMVLYVGKVQDKDKGTVHMMRTKGTHLVEAGDPYGNLPETMEFDYSALLKAMETNSKDTKTNG